MSDSGVFESKGGMNISTDSANSICQGKPDDVLISREWLTELMRDAYRYRFVQRGNSTHVLCGIWVSSPRGGESDHYPDEGSVDAIVDAGMKMKEWK